MGFLLMGLLVLAASVSGEDQASERTIRDVNLFLDMTQGVGPCFCNEATPQQRRATERVIEHPSVAAEPMPKDFSLNFA